MLLRVAPLAGSGFHSCDSSHQDARWLDASRSRQQTHAGNLSSLSARWPRAGRTSSRPPAQCGIGRGRIFPASPTPVDPRQWFYYTCRRKPGKLLARVESRNENKAAALIALTAGGPGWRCDGSFHWPEMSWQPLRLTARRAVLGLAITRRAGQPCPGGGAPPRPCEIFAITALRGSRSRWRTWLEGAEPEGTRRRTTAALPSRFSPFSSLPSSCPPSSQVVAPSLCISFGTITIVINITNSASAIHSLSK
jgi:hypothetical protein